MPQGDGMRFAVNNGQQNDEVPLADPDRSSSVRATPRRWRVVRSGRRPLKDAPILIGAILFAAVIGLMLVVSPGTDTEGTAPSVRVEEIERALIEALGPSAAAEIEPTVEGEGVRLRGRVSSEADRARAVETVLAVEGVAEVTDELRGTEPAETSGPR